jgi:hypothetical protein
VNVVVSWAERDFFEARLGWRFDDVSADGFSLVLKAFAAAVLAVGQAALRRSA